MLTNQNSRKSWCLIVRRTVCYLFHYNIKSLSCLIIVAMFFKSFQPFLEFLHVCQKKICKYCRTKVFFNILVFYVYKMVRSCRKTNFLLVARYLLLFTCYLLLVTFYSLSVTFYSLLVTFYSLLITFYSVLLTRYSLLLSCYFLLIITRYFLLVTRYFSFVTRYYLFVNLYLLFIRYYLFVTHYFLVVIFVH